MKYRSIRFAHALCLLALVPAACTEDVPARMETDSTLPECEPPTSDEVTAFRFDDLAVVDPHLYFKENCADLSEVANNLIRSAINQDADNDGTLDASLVVAFQPLEAECRHNEASLVVATCSAPLEETTCTPRTVTETIATNRVEGSCLEVLEGTTGPDYAQPTFPEAPCFVTDPVDLEFRFGPLMLPLEDARIAASYGPNGRLVDGVVRGFVSLEAARTVLVPPQVAILGGLPLSEVFLGDGDACAMSGNDLDEGPNGEPGWYIYFAYEARTVDYEPGG